MKARTFVLTILLLAAATCAYAADLPTAEEILAKVTAAWGAMKSYEADQQVGVVLQPNMTVTTTANTVMERSEKDGKTVEKFSIAEESVRRATDGKDEVSESRIVSDGTFRWRERRFPGDIGLRVWKDNAENTPIGLQFNGLFPGSALDWKDYHLKTVGEDTIDGQKMYVLEGTIDPTALVKGLKESKMKVWVRQADFIIRKRVLTMQGADEDKPMVFTMEFLNVKVNEKVDPALFVYTPPEGAKIIDHTQPAK